MDQMIKNNNPKDIKIIKSKGFEGPTNFGFSLCWSFHPSNDKAPQTPKPAPVATQTVSIDAVDRNNMYRRNYPNYGMGGLLSKIWIINYRHLN